MRSLLASSQHAGVAPGWVFGWGWRRRPGTSPPLCWRPTGGRAARRQLCKHRGCCRNCLVCRGKGLARACVLADDFRVLQIELQPSPPLPRYASSLHPGFSGIPVLLLAYPGRLCKGSAGRTQPSPLPSKPGLTIALLTCCTSSGTLSSSAHCCLLPCCQPGPNAPLTQEFPVHPAPARLGMLAGAQPDPAKPDGCPVFWKERAQLWWGWGAGERIGS